MQYIMFLIVAFLSTGAIGKTASVASCKPIPVKGDTVIIKTKKPALLFIHNLSTIDLWITHPVSEPSASAGFSSRLQASNWSALALSQKTFELSCIESKPGHEQQIPCEGSISICQLRDSSITKNANGMFWAGENMKLGKLKEYLGTRGFKLPGS